ncbi:hypothetical protein AKJ16_DCAP16220 [Drosera capensis]
MKPTMIDLPAGVTSHKRTKAHTNQLQSRVKLSEGLTVGLYTGRADRQVGHLQISNLNRYCSVE